MLNSYLIPGSIDDKKPEDTDEINSLIHQLSPNLKKLSCSKIVKKLKNPNMHVRIVEDEGVIVGMATLYIVDIFAGINAKIEDVVVDEKYRRRGIASDMLQGLISHAREKGVEHIDLTSNPERPEAIELYKELGFKMIAKATKGGTNLFRLELEE